MQTRYLTNIQQLRGISAFVVLLAHVLQSAQKRVFGDDSFLIDGGVGVDIFFVISGFIMVGVTHDAFGAPGSSRSFMIRRMARIVPIYWLYTAVLIALLIAAGKPPAAMEIVTSFLFIPLDDGTGRFRPILGQGWTLELEMMFYVIFAACLAFRRSTGMALLCAALVALPIAGMFIHSGPFHFWTSAILLEFLIGVLIGLAYRSRKPTDFPGHIPLILGIIAIWLVAVRVLGPGNIYDWRFGSWAAAGAVVAIAVFARQTENRKGVLSWLGDISYSLYLVHILVLLVVAKVSDEMFGERITPGLGVAYVAVTIAGSLLAAAISYRWIERPMERFVRGLFEKSPSRPSGSVGA
ncbi:acyltransferase family protein [Novosphingobium sp. FGD1]|uniref:Acyltransferase family protein n=1 Tax=Novosphingobium silvae TaxID=2692619 RepID=A0A7X4GHZ3_9SPHN|nr:acyltransferase [Novosphingobium silvae]MYL99000.1 acyltransferase family protein [Novosphingobium silvae]